MVWILYYVIFLQSIEDTAMRRQKGIQIIKSILIWIAVLIALYGIIYFVWYSTNMKNETTPLQIEKYRNLLDSGIDKASAKRIVVQNNQDNFDKWVDAILKVLNIK